MRSARRVEGFYRAKFTVCYVVSVRSKLRLVGGGGAVARRLCVGKRLASVPLMR
jgi:hypothetical protein